jgi:hypothetical protein
MNFDDDELALEFIEQDAEDHLTVREALLLGLTSDTDTNDSPTDWYA